jgi:hypothetical protein
MSQDKDGRTMTRATGDADGDGLALATGDAPLPDAAAAGPAHGRRPINDAALARIGRGLRLHYADVLALPIPERLRTLIDDLAACSETEASR